MRGTFDNSSTLIRFVLRRERVTSALWIAVLIFFSIVVPLALNNMFPPGEDLQVMAETMKNPAMIAMMGPVYGADSYTIGAMQTNEMLLFTIIAVAIMNIFLVIRHTRGDEERGRIEVVRSLPVGRLAHLHATMVVAVCVNATIAVVCGFSMAALGIESMDFAGSILFGAVLGVSGLFFAAVAALFSQLSASARGATGYSFSFLGLCYMVRAVGDMSSETLARSSPLGLILRAQVYVENHWWPLLLVFLLAVIAAAIAYYLNFIRDMDQGLMPARPGRKNASARLSTPFGLSFRLLRNTLIAWIIGMFAFGTAYGSVMGDLESFISNNEFYQQLIPSSSGHSTSELFITMLNSILSMVCTVPAFIAVLKLRGEEKESRAEHVLARAVSRTRNLASYTAISFAASILMPFAGVLGLWAASYSVMDMPIGFGVMLAAMMVYLPALWVMIGMAVLLVGHLPKATNLTWTYLGFTFFTLYIGRMIDLPEWLGKLTPFGYIPQLPIDTVNYAALAALTLIAAGLTTAGFIFYRKRDMIPA